MNVDHWEIGESLQRMCGWGFFYIYNVNELLTSFYVVQCRAMNTPLIFCDLLGHNFANIYKLYTFQHHAREKKRPSLKAILRLFIYKAVYDQSYLGSKTTMTTGEWSCLISFAWDSLTCSERRGGSEKFKMKIFVPSGIRAHASPRHD